MNITEHFSSQGSPEWQQLRLGKVTASRVADVVARTKTGGVGASRANYMAELILERLTNERGEHVHSKAMDDGTRKEPLARGAYRRQTNLLVKEIGFVPHPKIAMSGASPDGFVGDDGLVEFKCPYAATHLELLLGGSIPGKYADQMQWGMACTGRQWCDFVDYDPRFPPAMQLIIKRVRRDESRITFLTNEVLKFLKELDVKLYDLCLIYETSAESSPAPEAVDDGSQAGEGTEVASASPAIVERSDEDIAYQMGRGAAGRG